jgi:ubiquinone/menaquinone biosynthesis C-methylase UbiE
MVARTGEGKAIVTRNKRCLFGGLVASSLFAAGWVLYTRRSRQRIVGHEGLDDPEIAAGFNRVATMPQMRLLRWTIARRAARLTPRGEAADLGCGPGLLVAELVRQATGLRVTGVDISDEMLAQAESTARQAGLGGRAAFKKGDAQQLPFPDGSLDLVVSTLSLHHWRDPVAVFDEVARVLRPAKPDPGRPGGSFLIFDLRRDLAMPFWLLLWFATHVVVPPALRRAKEPLASRDASYTPAEAATLVSQSQLTGWRVTSGPLWLIVEGHKVV